MEAFYLIQQRLGLAVCESSAPIDLESFLFVSIDLEYNSKRVTQLGISTFDPRTLISSELGNSASISNEYPISSTLYSTKTCKYQERRRKPSHFGQQHLLVSKELQPILKGILTPQDEQGYAREVVLVGHSIASDLKVIKNICGLDIPRDIPSIKTILDTQFLSQTMLGSEKPLSLKNLLIALDLEYIGLHNAAHDSRYTLRALLLMLCNSVQQPGSTTPATAQDQTREQRLTMIKQIAKFHKRRGRILWCENSPRVKLEGDPDLLNQEYDCFDANEGGFLAGIM